MLELISQNKTFGGWHKQYRHISYSTHCAMHFAIFLPESAGNKPLPVLYWLSGLTCSDENFMQKAAAFQAAAELGIAIVAPDTSPRGEDAQGNAVANDEAYDLGQGAGFYLNATEQPWAPHFRMYDYIVEELPALIEANFPVSAVRAISGHSMGGHGAITIGLKNPERYTSISAFSPITNPVNCPWGEKAFSAYLGSDRESWKAYDSCELMALATEQAQQLPLLVDQGLADNFLAEQLKPEALEQAAAQVNYPLTLNRHEGYDHSYYFISSFISDHLRFHAQYLNG